MWKKLFKSLQVSLRADGILIEHTVMVRFYEEFIVNIHCVGEFS
jgi:hypothetical protein